MTVKIELDNREIVAALDKIQRSSRDLHQPLDNIGAHIVSEIDLLFRDERDPYGNDWEPLSEVTIKKRRKGPRSGNDKILNDTGRLKNSITHNVLGNSVEVGTNVVYAAIHQFGAAKHSLGQSSPWGDVPARPFLPTSERGVPDDWVSEILDIIAKHIEI